MDCRKKDEILKPKQTKPVTATDSKPLETPVPVDDKEMVVQHPMHDNGKTVVVTTSGEPYIIP